MASFIRPEARAALLRWRESLVGVLALALAFLFSSSGGLLAYVGPVIGIVAVGLIWLGFQRARFRGDDAGVGTVQVVEGQITYFGPQTGGAVSVIELERLTLDGTAYPAHWRLDQPGVPELAIPVNAHGADALFDAFAQLPDFRIAYMLSELEDPAKRAVVIWEKHPMRPKHIRVH